MKIKMNATFGIVGCLVTLLLSQSAAAEVDESHYQMTVIADDAFGGRIVSGKYAMAIERLSNPKRKAAKEFPTQTNLCVAYTKQGDLGKAEAACDMAIDLVLQNPLYAKRSRFLTREKLARDHAIALSNRGVLLAIQGKTALAAIDFQYAADLETGLDAPNINLAKATP